MRCSGSLTTCTAAERTPVRAFEAVLFAQVMRPLARSLGDVGELALGVVTQRLFAPETLRDVRPT